MGKFVVKYHKLILALAVGLIIPSFIGFFSTRVNYDMLNYLPSQMDTMKGQAILKEEFNKGAFSMIIVENLDDAAIAKLETTIKNIEHVDSVLSLGTIENAGLPAAILPENLYHTFHNNHESLMAVFFDTSTSADETLTAITKIRQLMDNLHVSGMSAFVLDLKETSKKEQLHYIIIAVSLALLVMIMLLDNWLIPFILLISIAVMILINLGTNIIFGEISYVTKALSAVLQLAVTMDYSIFLWHSYREYLKHQNPPAKAMALAIETTLSSVLGSSATTIAGFIALCFMTFTMGLDLGLVMAKGVLLGVIGSITILPAMILIFHKLLFKLDHRPLLPNFDKLSNFIIKAFPVLLIIFGLILPPAIYGYSQTNANVNYVLGNGLPSDTPSHIANTKLSENFGLSNVHMILSRADLPESTMRSMTQDLQNIAGIKSVINLTSLTNAPLEILPDQITNLSKGQKWELTLAISAYQTASTEIAEQIQNLNQTIKSYDASALLIGESSCTEDMIKLTASDFQVVNTISIIAIFIIIIIVTKSISLPLILITLIETAIFINLAISYYEGTSLSFIAPICISTIQLGATVDYAILLTTRYKYERIRNHHPSKAATKIALTTSIPSILISGAVLFAATIGVAIYSRASLISSICLLLARGAIISLIVVPLFLPPLLILADPLIVRTTLDMKNLITRKKS